MIDALVFVSRYLIVLPFALGAYGNLVQPQSAVRLAADRGVPWPRLSVLAAGVLAALGSVSLLLGLWVDLGALLLLAFLVPVTLGTHAFWRLSEPEARIRERLEFQQCIAMLGGLIVLFAVTNLQQKTPYGLSSPLFPPS